jgi:predicted SAM-dependent methyltransferase
MLLKRIAHTVLPLGAQRYVRSVVGRRRAERILAEKHAAGEELRLEIGSGPVRGRNGLITLDLYTRSDVCWDLRMPLPFPDNTASLVYSSHLMEHFGYQDLIRLLKDCLRILKPGGVYSACVPDASIYVRAYSEDRQLDASYLAYRPAVISDSKMDVVNYIAYMAGDHRFMFDQENLARVLSVVGFSSVCIREFDGKLDLPERRQGSIYVEGVKP